MENETCSPTTGHLNITLIPFIETPLNNIFYNVINWNISVVTALINAVDKEINDAFHQ